MTRHQVARFVLRPFYRLRSWALSRMYRRDPPRHVWWDRAIRSACEAVLDTVEMWEMKPNFERMEKQIAELDAINDELIAIQERFGITIPEEQ